MRTADGRCVWSLMILLSLPAVANAQAEAPVGVRAAGMGGAFTAVADDASAAFWNPAGFASGAFVSLVVDANLLDRRSGALVALGTPPLGLSYYRSAIAAEKNGRNTLVAHHAGVSLVQSVGVGVMSTGSLGQLGLSIRNLLQPEFKTPGAAIRLDRRVRAGVSIHVRQSVTVAADLDLTRAMTPRGDWRDAALGLEAHPVRNAWLRGGVHWNTAGGSAAPIASIGASYALYGATMADAQVSFGSAEGDRGWGVGLRFVF
jgi:hypothetical protein